MNLNEKVVNYNVAAQLLEYYNFGLDSLSIQGHLNFS